jgi:heat shock protein HslJ
MNKNILLLMVTVTLLLPSCQTTGDPSTGGIFWSEKKAQQRVQEKQSELDRIQGKTKAEQSAASAREKSIKALQ